jgi:hypothetical protein
MPKISIILLCSISVSNEDGDFALESRDEEEHWHSHVDRIPMTHIRTDPSHHVDSMILCLNKLE